MADIIAQIMKLAASDPSVVVTQAGDGVNVTIKKPEFTPVFNSWKNIIELTHVEAPFTTVYKFSPICNLTSVETSNSQSSYRTILNYDPYLQVIKEQSYNGLEKIVDTDHVVCYSATTKREYYPGSNSSKVISVTNYVHGVPKRYVSYDIDNKLHGNIRFQVGTKCLILTYEHGKYVSACISEEKLTQYACKPIDTSQVSSN